MLHGFLQDLSSLTRDWTLALGSKSATSFIYLKGLFLLYARSYIHCSVYTYDENIFDVNLKMFAKT